MSNFVNICFCKRGFPNLIVECLPGVQYHGLRTLHQDYYEYRINCRKGRTQLEKYGLDLLPGLFCLTGFSFLLSERFPGYAANHKPEFVYELRGEAEAISSRIGNPSLPISYSPSDCFSEGHLYKLTFPPHASQY